MNPDPFFEPKAARSPTRAEALLTLFLHVNRELSPFQRQCIETVLDPECGPDDYASVIQDITRQCEILDAGGWSPDKAKGSDPVNLPDHYGRLPMEPTYFIVESGGFHWCIENFIKYICRYRWKNGVEDLRKAARNLAMYIRWLDGDPAWSR